METISDFSVRNVDLTRSLTTQHITRVTPLFRYCNDVVTRVIAVYNGDYIETLKRCILVVWLCDVKCEAVLGLPSTFLWG